MFASLRKFSGGALVPHKKRTAQVPTKTIEPPTSVLLPLQQHIGAVCKATVKAKELVTVGQVIATGTGYVSAPIHAPVSGKVKSIKPTLLANGQSCEAILIENDGLNTPHPALAPVRITSKDELLQAAYDSGVVGIGGAGFPLHVKLATKDAIDTLVINGAECEPFITSDNREAIEEPQRILRGIVTLLDWLEIPRSIIGIESNKPEAIATLTAQIQALELTDRITLQSLPPRYPQGAEKMLIFATTKRRVPTGGLPSAVGCLVLNISTVSVFQHYLDTGVPLITKRITVDGDNISQPQNLLVPIGTPIQSILEACGGLKVPGGKVILGGPMMGIAQYDTQAPVTKQTNAITCLKTALPAESPCIRCGRCSRSCPMRLLPLEIERALKIQDQGTLTKLQVQSCMECGTCAFVCPSGRKLVQRMKEAKQIERRPVS